MCARSFLLRYEPSGVVGFAYRERERERERAGAGASTPQVLTATAYEQLAAVTAGAIAAVAAFILAGVHPPLAALVLLAVLATARPARLGDRLVSWAAQRGVSIAGPLRQCAGWATTAAGARS